MLGQAPISEICKKHFTRSTNEPVERVENTPSAQFVYTTLPVCSKNNSEASASACIDTASEINLISPHFSQQLNIVYHDAPHIHLLGVNGKPLSDALLTKATTLSITLPNGHTVTASFYLTPGLATDLQVGASWLAESKAIINCSTKSISFLTDCQTLLVEKSVKQDVLNVLPTQHQKYLSLFLPKMQSLPPHRTDFDHNIKLTPNATPRAAKLRQFSPRDQQLIQAEVNKLIELGHVVPSKSEWASNVVLASKKDGTSRVCFNYAPLNEVTVRDSHPFPNSVSLFDTFLGATVFTKLDLKSAYHLLRLAEGCENLTAFRTHQGLYEFRVMPFGLSNAPASFQRFVNHVLNAHIGKCAVAYQDDIIIYSADTIQHTIDVNAVLASLAHHQLTLKASKCQFYASSVEFLGLTLSPAGTQLSNSKIQCVLDWPIPTRRKQVRSFLGFTNFFRRFIKNYSQLALPLTDLTVKDKPFKWTQEATLAFNNLKQATTTAPTLQPFDPSLPTKVEADASNFALGAILSQQRDALWHPIAFHSAKFDSTQINWPIREKELFAIVSAFKHWSHYLHCVPPPIEVITDHQSLQYFTQPQHLSAKLARWSAFLMPFTYTITYQPGHMSKPDALSRIGSNETEPTIAPVLQPIVGHTIVQISSTPVSTILEAYSADPQVAKLLSSNTQKPYKKLESGLLTFKGRVYIPDDHELKLQLLRQFHDHQASGHFGIKRTIRLISRTYFWPRMKDFVTKYIVSCQACQANKVSRAAPQGMLQSLTVPTKPFESVSTDFIVGLPLSSTFEDLMVVVDRYTKFCILIPLSRPANASVVANALYESVICKFGVPSNIVSDRDVRFTSDVWASLSSMLKVELSMSSAHHPRTDGQTERFNSTIEQYLRMYINFQQDDWSQHLNSCTFALNNAVSESTKMSPNEVLFGYQPTFFPAPDLQPDIEPTNIEQFVSNRRQIFDRCMENISLAQQTHAKNFNKHRTAPHNFKPGDQVWLINSHISTERPSQKLGEQKHGPFRILEPIGTRAFKLQLHPSSRIHPVFHVEHLLPYHSEDERLPLAATSANSPSSATDDSAISSIDQSTPSPVVDSNKITRILSKRTRGVNTQYRVQYGSNSLSHYKWEPAWFCTMSCPGLLQEFEKDQQH